MEADDTLLLVCSPKRNTGSVVWQAAGSNVCRAAIAKQHGPGVAPPERWVLVQLQQDRNSFSGVRLSRAPRWTREHNYGTTFAENIFTIRYGKLAPIAQVESPFQLTCAGTWVLAQVLGSEEYPLPQSLGPHCQQPCCAKASLLRDIRQKTKNCWLRRRFISNKVVGKWTTVLHTCAPTRQLPSGQGWGSAQGSALTISPRVGHLSYTST